MPDDEYKFVSTMMGGNGDVANTIFFLNNPKLQLYVQVWFPSTDVRFALPSLLAKQEKDHVDNFVRCGYPVCWNDEIVKSLPKGPTQTSLKEMAFVRECIPEAVDTTYIYVYCCSG